LLIHRIFFFCYSNSCFKGPNIFYILYLIIRYIILVQIPVFAQVRHPTPQPIYTTPKPNKLNSKKRKRRKYEKYFINIFQNKFPKKSCDPLLDALIQFRNRNSSFLVMRDQAFVLLTLQLYKYRCSYSTKSADWFL
jgi:hypothetical protein